MCFVSSDAEVPPFKSSLSRYVRLQSCNRQEVVIEMSRIESRMMPRICLFIVLENRYSINMGGERIKRSVVA